MGIISFNVFTTGLVGDQVNPRRNTMVTTDNLATITTAGYLNNQNVLGNQLLPTDVFDVLYSFNQQTQVGIFGIFTLSYSSSTGWTLVEWVDPGNVLLPVVAGDFANFNGTNGQLADLGFSPSNAAKTKVVMANSATVAGDIASFVDTTGTVGINQNNATNAITTSSSTPGTIRSIIGSMTGSASVMASGNLVGVRGVVNYVGASGGFLYGTQGKLIPTGTISGSSWNAGLFGQLDISAATINAGQMAPIWGDYGTSSGTLTDQTGLYGIAMTNTTAAILQGQLYLYGGAQNLMLLSTNAGLSGVTYFKNAGTGSGSWGNGTPPTPSKVLKINVDGTDYYLPLVAQNS